MNSGAVDWGTIINLASALLSVALAIIAIWLSIYFYTKGKDTEKETSSALAAIKAQSEALQKLTGRWMDRFTRHATEPKPLDEGLLSLVNAVANLPTLIITQLKPQPDTATQETLIAENINCYVLLYHYAALANVLAQGLLPSEDYFDPAESTHSTLASIIDNTVADFNRMANLLNNVHPTRIEQSTYINLLRDTVNRWQPLVKDKDGVFENRRNAESGG